MSWVLAHDVGSSSIKTALVGKDGSIAARASYAYDFYYPQPGWAEQDPEDYWKGCVANTRKVLEEAGIRKEEVMGMVFSTQAMGIIPMDGDGKALMNNISWVDGRAEEQARWLMRLMGGKAAFKQLIGLEITGKDVIPKLRWLKQNKPDIYDKCESILDVNGYLKYRSTGRMVFEWSGACSYGFSLKKKDWERTIFKVAGFDLNKLPPLVRSTDMVGTLSPEAARELGLDESVKVFGGCDDTQSAALGSGSIDEGDAHIYLGTSAWAAVTTARNLKHKRGAAVLQSADPSKNLAVGITESAGSNLDWMIEKFYQLEKEDPRVKNIYEFINSETKGIPAGSDHLIFTPWLLGERCPVSTTTTRGTVFNLGQEHTRGHFVNAVLEGVGYNLRWIFENYRNDFGFRPSTIRAIGGGSVNAQWMQGIADITGMKVETTDQPTMAGALGAAACAFVGNGDYKDFNAMQEVVLVKNCFTPNPATKVIYDELFQSYKAIYKNLRKPYKKANLARFNS